MESDPRLWEESEPGVPEESDLSLGEESGLGLEEVLLDLEQNIYTLYKTDSYRTTNEPCTTRN